ncbi:MAG: hypothetical protein O2983_08545 [Planctomycetota bacterium]|nr:hypothetical protein [Planctomycetota bacterium]MDA0919876.1 hypothetical protein [Planctomycetota bacterium]MDA1159644.1 hypothetical protein [Planctomycetota bacterium]
MLTKIYQVVGLTLCIGLGTAFALGWKAPDLFDGKSSGGTGRSGFFFSSGGGSGSGGFHFGK